MTHKATVQRRNVEVAQLHCEVNHALYDRMIEYTVLYGISRRDIVAEALLLWLNGQDKLRQIKEV